MSYLIKSRQYAKQLLNWAVMVLPALALVYSLLFSVARLGVSFFVLNHKNMVLYSVSPVLVSSSLDRVIWPGAVLLFSVWLFYTLLVAGGAGRRGVLLVLVPLVLVILSVFGVFGFLPLVLASLVIIVLSSAFSQVCFGVSWFSVVKRLLLGVVLVLFFVEVVVLVLFSVPLLSNLPTPSSSALVHWQLLELSLTNLAYPILPYCYLAFIALSVIAYAVKVAPARLRANWRNWRVFKFADGLSDRAQSCRKQDRKPLNWRFWLSLTVFVSVGVSFLFVVVTVLPWINPTNRLVSVDAPEYFQWLAHMRSLDANSALFFAFTNDRSVILVLDYVLSFVVSGVVIVQFMPAFLLALFCVVSLFVVRLVCGFREVWIYCVLLVPFSLQGFGLIYAGYFANMLAMVFVYAYFILLLWVFRSRSALGVLGLLVLSVLVLFSHSWTWYIFALSLIAFLFIDWRSAAGEPDLRRNFKWKATVIGGSVGSVGVGLVCYLVYDFVRHSFTQTSAFISVFKTAQAQVFLSVPNGATLLGGLRLTTNFYLGGVFSNEALFILAVIGFLFMLSFKSEMSKLLVSWFFLSCMLLLFNSSEAYVVRFLFLMPSAVFAGLGLSFLIRFVVYNSKASHAKKLGFELLVVLFIILMLFNFGLRYVSNINIV